MSPLPCPACQSTTEVKVEETSNPYGSGYEVTCWGCYDYCPCGDCRPPHVSSGATREDAVREWNYYVEDALEAA